ncbi:MAG: oligosaccharide flippase family protein [Clostridium sp.]|nr:oligosaccharide flippase family protein [Clostridium sp.]
MILRQGSIKKNLIYQMIYQILVFFIPLVISPYLTRTLGGQALGVYSYSNAFAYYFVVLAMLGITRYGQRAISVVKNNEVELRKTFWSLYIVHFAISCVAVLLYFIFVAIYNPSEKIIYIIQGIYVASSIFDVTWLFYGLENFKSVVIKNFLVKIMELIFIFCFVKNPSDLWVYTLIISISIMLGQLMLIPTAVKNIVPIRFKAQDTLVHIKPLLTLWISVIASTLYTVFDRTLIGAMTETVNVAFYEYADKIVRVPIAVLGAISTVTYPRMCALVANDKGEESQKVFIKSFIITTFLSSGAVSLIISIAKDFSILYYGQEFELSGMLMIFLSPIIMIISIGDIVRTQILIPHKMDKQFSFCITINAIVNLILSGVLIPIIGVYGAVIGTVAAEICGLILNTLYSKEHIKVEKILKIIGIYLAITMITTITVYIVRTFVIIQSLFFSVVFNAVIVSLCYVSLSIISYFYFIKKYDFFK